MARRRAQRDLASILVGGAAGAIGTSIVKGYYRNNEAGSFVLPAYHEPGVRVPHGGSSCANCKYLRLVRNGEPHCWEPHFATWNGGTRLPVDDPNEYCSDWWQPDAEAKRDIARDREDEARRSGRATRSSGRSGPR